MNFIRCGSNKVPVEACKIHSMGFLKNGTPIDPDPKVSDFAHCIDCVSWVDTEDDAGTVEDQVARSTSKTVAKRNKAAPIKRAKNSDDLDETYLVKCEDIGELTVWLCDLNMPSLLRLAKSIGIKGFGLKKDVLIGEIIAREGGKNA